MLHVGAFVGQSVFAVQSGAQTAKSTMLSPSLSMRRHDICELRLLQRFWPPVMQSRKQRSAPALRHNELLGQTDSPSHVAEHVPMPRPVSQ